MLMPGAALPATLSTSGITTPVLSQGQALEAVTQGISQKDTTFTKIFVGGLPYHTTDKSLREHFEVYGEIEEAVVITDRQTGKSRGYGFVTMADKGGADRAIKEPNPVIDGRKANVNLAYLGAKPRGPAADASSSLLLRQVAASQPYFATTQLLQQRAAFQPVNMAQAAAAAQGAYGNQMAAAAAAGMTTQLRYPIPSPTLVAGGTGTMQSIDYGGLHAISSATDPYGIGSTAVTAAASSTTTGEMSAIPDSPSEDYADSPNSGDGSPPPAASPPVVFPSLPPPLPAGAAAPTNNLAGSPLCYNTTTSSPDAAAAAAAAGSASTQLPQRVTSTSRHLRLHPYSSIPLTGVRYPTVLPGQYGEPGPGSAGGVVRTPRASHTFSPYTRIHPNYVYHPSFMQTAAGLLPMAATAPVAHASQLAATQAYYDYAATAATAAYPATYPATAATAASLEPYAAAVSAASAMYGTGYSWQQAAAAQAAAVAASAGNIPGFSYATQPQMAQEAARMQ